MKRLSKILKEIDTAGKKQCKQILTFLLNVSHETKYLPHLIVSHAMNCSKNVKLLVDNVYLSHSLVYKGRESAVSRFYATTPQ